MYSHQEVAALPAARGSGLLLGLLRARPRGLGRLAGLVAEVGDHERLHRSLRHAVAVQLHGLFEDLVEVPLLECVACAFQDALQLLAPVAHAEVLVAHAPAVEAAGEDELPGLRVVAEVRGVGHRALLEGRRLVVQVGPDGGHAEAGLGVVVPAAAQHAGAEVRVRPLLLGRVEAADELAHGPVVAALHAEGVARGHGRVAPRQAPGDAEVVLVHLPLLLQGTRPDDGAPHAVGRVAGLRRQRVLRAEAAVADVHVVEGAEAEVGVLRDRLGPLVAPAGHLPGVVAAVRPAVERPRLLGLRLRAAREEALLRVARAPGGAAEALEPGLLRLRRQRVAPDPGLAQRLARGAVVDGLAPGVHVLGHAHDLPGAEVLRDVLALE
mmetsp:Transcript_119591/g.386104  ORF Transcript_119591/g.386104 Transcript_119591/m.386104 type:complete len:381 (-) Transcript_119591:337-1479(-)